MLPPPAHHRREARMISSTGMGQHNIWLLQGCHPVMGFALYLPIIEIKQLAS